MSDKPHWWRVSFTPGSIAGVVTAKQRHRCEGHLADVKHYIEPGDRYVANALPPNNSEIGNVGWWHMRVCMDCCPAKFVEDLRAARDAARVRNETRDRLDALDDAATEAVLARLLTDAPDLTRKLLAVAAEIDVDAVRDALNETGNPA